MAIIDKTYHNLLNDIINTGFKYEDPNRKGVNRIQIPHYQLIHDFKDGFPAITTKKLYWKGVVGELLWFLRGDTNIKYLVDNNINIWNKDAYNYYKKTRNDNDITYKDFISWIKGTYKQGEVNIGGGDKFDLGRIYGSQWRDWTKNNDIVGGYRNSIDQISNLIKNLKEKPLSTNHIVTAWNPAELDDMALPPCHWSFEILVEPLSNEELIEECAISSNPYTKEPMAMLVGQDDKELYDKNIQNKAIKLINKYNIPKYKFTLKWHQRSVDSFLGLPFNVSSYALLAHIIGKLTNMIPKSIIGDLSNVHIYEPHLDAVKGQLSRDVDKYDGLKTKVVDFHDIKDHYNDKELDNLLNELDINENFKLKNYESYPTIPAEMLPYNK